MVEAENSAAGPEGDMMLESLITWHRHHAGDPVRAVWPSLAGSGTVHVDPSVHTAAALVTEAAPPQQPAPPRH
jgi:hypothetical protein